MTLLPEDLRHMDAKLSALWPSLRGARLFMTGGTGFFGTWLTETLLAANTKHQLGLTLTILSRDPGRFLRQRAPHLQNNPALHFIQGDLTDFIVPDDVRYSHILHLATETNLQAAPDWAERHLNAVIDGTRRLLDMAARHKTEAVLLTSSGAVYGQADTVLNQRCVESQNHVADYLTEKAVYGQGKRLMETLASMGAQKHGYRALIARCFCFVGPYLPLDGNYAVGNFIRDALANRAIEISGDGTPLRSYLYAADLVIWLLTILVKGQSGRPYNVGGDEAVSIADLAHKVVAVADRKLEIHIRQQAVSGATPSAYLPDISRARHELGLDVFVDLTESIRRSMAWYRSQPEFTS